MTYFVKNIEDQHQRLWTGFIKISLMAKLGPNYGNNGKDVSHQCLLSSVPLHLVNVVMKIKFSHLMLIGGFFIFDYKLHTKITKKSRKYPKY